MLGRQLRARAVPSELADWLREYGEQPDRGAAPSTHRIELASHDQPLPADGPWTNRDVPLLDRTLPFRQSGQRWRVGNTESGAQLQVAHGSARIDAWGVRAAADPEALYLALYVMITEGVRASGLIPLHGSVAAHNGAATAWLGASGQGKSTTLLRAARSGWRPIAEDLSWIDPASLQLFGWDRTIRVWPETLEKFFPDLDGPAATDGKRMIPYSAVGGAEPRSGRLARLALLARAPDRESGWETVTALETARALWEATGVPLSQLARDHAARGISELVRRVPAARLVLGNTDPPLAAPV